MAVCSKKICCVLCFLSLAPTFVAEAKVYRWVDDNGKVHFSDEPPHNSIDTAQELNISSNLGSSSLQIPSVTAGKPITRSGSVKKVLLESVSFEYKMNQESNPSVGRAYKFSNFDRKKISQFYSDRTLPMPSMMCSRDGDIKLNNAKYIFNKTNFLPSFLRVFEENDYEVVSAKDKRFALQSSVKADLSVAGEIVDVKIDYCGVNNSRSLNGLTQNSTYMKVKWQVFDNLSRKVVLTIASEGAEQSLDKPPRENGAIVSAELAFLQSVENLLSKREFIDLLSFEEEELSIGSRKVEGNASIKATFGDASSSFIKKVDKIKESTVTIRTSSGHGSGFVVSGGGYVVTNHHVVEGSYQVLVIFEDQEFYASVVRSDSARDVALLKLNSDIQLPPLNLSSGRVSLGEAIYVVGTPLDESLDFTISRGIVSADRLIEGRPYLQTDAAINPGNSGGPVFNEKGNVIGITVAGHFSREGGSMNIGYIIPIEDALSKLGIE